MTAHPLTDVGLQHGSRYTPGCWGGEFDKYGCNARVADDDALGLCQVCRWDILGEGAPVGAGS